MRKTIDIEKLVTWAYRDELPKAVGGSGGIASIRSGYESITQYGELLTMIDRTNVYGMVPAFAADDDGPHADAVTVHRAVVALDGFDLDLPDDWTPMQELGQFGDLGVQAVAVALDRLTRVTGDGRRVLRRGPGALVRHHAIMGGCPDWHGEVPEMCEVRGPNGGPLWFRRKVERYDDAFGNPVEHAYEDADGWDVKRKVAKRGAYRKYRLVPDPVPALVARAEYEVWHAALAVLVEDLAGVLEAHEVRDTVRPARPWEPHDARASRILKAVSLENC
ncbi:MAG: hypothetical protein CML67_10805 [Rhodobacteraceae bacterium]|nr:hypothetical protein [Paracoccaceae bacterium]